MSPPIDRRLFLKTAGGASLLPAQSTPAQSTPGKMKAGTAKVDVTPNRPYQTGVGAAVTFNSVPSSLNSTYGSSPMGFWLFLRIRPAQMQHGSAMTGMGDMH